MTHWLFAYGCSSALNVALFVFLAKWRRRALLAETELAARELMYIDDTPDTFDRRERVTK